MFTRRSNAWTAKPSTLPALRLRAALFYPNFDSKNAIVRPHASFAAASS